MSWGAAAPDMSFWLGRKYALQQQAADAGTQNAKTNALTGEASAALTRAQTSVLPAESAANVAQTKAQTGLIGETTKYFGPEAMARIGKMGAETNFIGTQDKVLTRESLTPAAKLFGPSIGSMPSMYQLSNSTTPANRASVAKRLMATPRSKWAAGDLDDFQTLFD